MSTRCRLASRLSPTKRGETRRRDRAAAIATDAVRAVLHAVEGLFDGLQDLGVGHLQLELNLDLVGPTGLVGQIALTAVHFGRGRNGPGAGRRREDLGALPEEHVLQVREGSV